MHYFEDMTVGDTETFGEWTVTKDELVSFAEQWDPQPIHVDEEAAAESLHGGLIASGLHTVAIAMRLWVEEYLVDVANLGARGISKLEWHQPVRPGDTLTVSGEVLEKTLPEESKGHGYVDYDLSVHNGDDDHLMTMVSNMAVTRQDD